MLRNDTHSHTQKKLALKDLSLNATQNTDGSQQAQDMEEKKKEQDSLYCSCQKTKKQQQKKDIYFALSFTLSHSLTHIGEHEQ